MYQVMILQVHIPMSSVMVTHKFPMSLFLKCNLKKFEQMSKNFAYLIHIRFKNIKCKYFNNFISQNKCTKITGR